MENLPHWPVLVVVLVLVLVLDFARGFEEEDEDYEEGTLLREGQRPSRT